MNNTSQHARTAGMALAAVVALGLTACSNPVDALADKISQEVGVAGAEKMIEGVTGGNVDLEFGQLPEGFPSDITLVSDDIIQSTSMEMEGGTGMLVAVNDPRGIDEVAEDVRADFAGWEEVSWHKLNDEMVGGNFSQGEAISVSVNLIRAESDDVTTVGYIVNIAD